MTAKQLFGTLGYKQTINNDSFIEYKEDTDDSEYVYIRFELCWKAYEVGYFDGNEKSRAIITTLTEHEAIIKQMKELGWIKEKEK